MSLNPLQDKNKQVCLIENGEIVLWCEEFEIVNTCHVSNNGTVVALVHNWISARDTGSQPGFLKKDLLAIINRNRDRILLRFDTREEFMTFALSQDGRFLVYNLQRYRPETYQLILYDIKGTEEKWGYKYPKEQMIHELAFKDDRILVYAGRRPSAYVDRRYSFTLDITGKRTFEDPEESQKQRIRDYLIARASDLADACVHREPLMKPPKLNKRTKDQMART